MTIEELEDTLPNGLHDGKLLRCEADYAHRTAVLDLDVDFDEDYRPVRLLLTGLVLFAVEPPYPDKEYFPIESTPNTCGYPTDERMLPKWKTYAELAPGGAFFYSFFLSSTNSFIHVAATDARMEFLPH